MCDKSYIGRPVTFNKEKHSWEHGYLMDIVTAGTNNRLRFLVEDYEGRIYAREITEVQMINKR